MLKTFIFTLIYFLIICFGLAYATTLIFSFAMLDFTFMLQILQDGFMNRFLLGLSIVMALVVALVEGN